MTAPAIDLATAGLEDLRPVYGQSRHDGGYRPAAAYWIDQHGCDEFLVCTPCFTEMRRTFDEALADDCILECGYCNQTFDTFEAIFTAVAL